MIQIKDFAACSLTVSHGLNLESVTPMSFKTVYAYFTTPAKAVSTSRTAASVAKQFDALLVGCHIMYEPIIPVYDLHGLEVMQPVIEQQRQIQRENANTLKKIFATAADHAQVDHEWQCDEEFHLEHSDIIFDRLRVADLVVISETETESIMSWKNIPARIALNSARPILVVPVSDEKKAETPFKRIIIAWNGENEAVRATFDSLPFLKAAEDVKLLTINPDENGENSSKAMTATLKRHGVAIKSEAIVDDELPTSTVLLSQCNDFEADLLVLGCYGRSRLQEIVFGGVTREVFQSMPLPVLMSH